MYQYVKRSGDVIAAIVALLLLSPFLLPIIIGLRLTGEGYIFYRQERVGYLNRPFKIYKFATMLKDSPDMAGGLITTKRDPRITPMGHFLRTSKINELPQLINILLGDMSIVGPRPVMRKSYNAYPEDVKKVIYQVKPGLTGIGSIVYRDEEELITVVKNRGGDTWDFYKDKIYPHKGKLEQWYQRNISFSIDLQLIVLTAWTIIVPSSELVYRLFRDIPRRHLDQ